MQIQTEYGTIELPDGSSQEAIEDAVDDFVSRSRQSAGSPSAAGPQKAKFEIPYSAASRIADMIPWSDELRGVIDGTALSALNKLKGRDAEWGKNVDQATDEARARREKFAEEHPIQNALAIGAGLVVGGAPRLAGFAADVLPGANYLSRLIYRDAPVGSVRQAVLSAHDEALAGLGSAAPSTLGSRIRNGAMVGGAVGALEGAGAADNGTLQDRALAGLGGGALGAGLGTAVPLVGAGLSSVWSRIRPLVGSGSDNAARDRILEALSNDGVTLQDAEARLSRWAADGARDETLAEALGGGANVAATLKAVGSVPGPAKEKIRKTFDTRMRGQAERVSADIPATTGAKDDFYGALDALSSNQRKTAAPMYDAAFANPMPPSDRLKNFLTNRHIRAGLTKGIDDELNYATAEGRPPVTFNQFVEFGPDGAVEAIKTPTWAILDTAKRGLDRIIGRAIEENNGKLPRDMDSLNDLRKSYTQFLRTHNDEYGQALDAWAGPAASQSALKMGRSAFELDAEEISRQVANLGPGDRQHYVEGLMRAVRDRVGDKNKSANGVSWWDADNVQAKLKAALGDEAFARFSPRMQRELDMANFSRRSNPGIGSDTAPNAETINAMQSAGGAFGSAVMNGRDLLGATGFAIRQLLNRRIYRDPRVNAEISDMLLEQDPMSQAVLLANLQGRIRDYAASGRARDATLGGITNSLGNAAGASTAAPFRKDR